LHLIVVSIKYLTSGTRLRRDLDKLMVSEMAIGGEVFGSCVGEIDVLVEIVNRGIWLCCEWSSFRFIWAGKAAQDWLQRWVRVPGIGSAFRCFWRD